MGLSTAGIAFRATSATPCEDEMIRQAFGEAFQAVPDAGPSHDIRVPGNLAVESKDGVTFVYNGEIADSVLFKAEGVRPSLLSALGNPTVAVVFCHYDSGGSFGYAIVEGSTRTRLRVHTVDNTRDEGSPKECEHSWLQAEAFVEEEGEPPAYRNLGTGQVTSEAYVTAYLLDEVVKSMFGVCPWHEWNYRTRFNYYRKAP